MNPFRFLCSVLATVLAAIALTTTALAQENLAITQQNPERAAQLVREWLNEANASESAG